MWRHRRATGELAALLLHLACLGALASCTFGRGVSGCVAISDAWRGPWPNGSAAAYYGGRVFYDNAISECSAFSEPCEDWIEFRAELGQVRCVHQDPIDTVRGAFLPRMLRHLAAWAQTHNREQTAEVEQRVNASNTSLISALSYTTNTEDNAWASAALRTTTSEELPWHDAMCDAHKLRSVRCRIVPTGTFRARRGVPYTRTQKTLGWLHDGFEWECTTSPSWLHVAPPGPVCAPFATLEYNAAKIVSHPWCVPVEQCVVFLDVQRSAAFSGLYMSAFVVTISAAAMAIVLTLYHRRGAMHSGMPRKRSFGQASRGRRDGDAARGFADYSFRPSPIGARPPDILSEYIIMAALQRSTVPREPT